MKTATVNEHTLTQVPCKKCPQHGRGFHMVTKETMGIHSGCKAEFRRIK